MRQKPPKVFLDTSVIFSAVLSPDGSARKLFQLGEAGVVSLCVGYHVLRECEEVVRRKATSSLSILARLLELGGIETFPAPTREQMEVAHSIVAYEPDAYVLAEAIRAEPDWFITHDRAHFLNEKKVSGLRFQVGTPGDLIQSLINNFKLP